MSRPALIARPSSRLTVDKTVVLVTGGDSGVGFEIVKALATTQPNFQVLMGCHDTANGEAAVATIGAPLNVNPIQLDIQDDNSIDHCRKAIEQLFGRLDILINNAETAGAELGDQATTNRTRQLWRHVLDINVASTGFFTEFMIPLLEKSQSPKIIFISSTAGSIGVRGSSKTLPSPGPWYDCSKAAVNMLTVHYAAALPRFKVNASCPGYSATLSTDIGNDQDTNAQQGAVNVIRLASEGSNGPSGTFSDRNGPISW